MVTINTSFKIEKEQMTNFENWFRNNLEVLDFKVRPDTKDLYEKNKEYQKLSKKKKEIQLQLDRFINENNI